MSKINSVPPELDDPGLKVLVHILETVPLCWHLHVEITLLVATIHQVLVLAFKNI